MNIQTHFREAYNKRVVHIEQLRLLRDKEGTDAATKRRLEAKIEHERRQLAVIDEIWDVH